MRPLPLSSSLFPYTTLFRSEHRPPRREQASARRSAARGRPGVGRRRRGGGANGSAGRRSEEHTSELQSRGHLVCRLLLEKKNKPFFVIRPIPHFLTCDTGGQ